MVPQKVDTVISVLSLKCDQLGLLLTAENSHNNSKIQLSILMIERTISLLKKVTEES